MFLIRLCNSENERKTNYSSDFFERYWMLLESLRSRFGGANRAQHPFAVVFGSGAVAGSLAAAITTPFDVIKTRMQQSVDKKSQGIFSDYDDLFVTLLSKECYKLQSRWSKRRFGKFFVCLCFVLCDGHKQGMAWLVSRISSSCFQDNSCVGGDDYRV
jgi:hypothetical protein